MKQIVARYFHICVEFKIMLGQDTLTFYCCDMANGYDCFYNGC